MKSEDIYNGITQIRDDQILEGERPLAQKRPRGMAWLGPLAAVLALIVVAGAIGLPMLKRQPQTEQDSAQTDGEPSATPSSAAPDLDGAAMPTDAPVPAELLAYNLTAPVYPQMAKYANDMDYYNSATSEFDWESYRTDREAWEEDQNALHSDSSYTDGMSSFLEKTVPVILAGDEEENRIYSPLNVWMALSMLTEITDGNTRQELLDLLGADSVEELRSRATSLWRCNYCDDDRVTSLLANSFWLRDGTTYNQSTLDTLAKDYYAASFSGPMGTEDYDRAMRTWVNRQTGGLLADQAEGIATDELTVLTLLSTIYYKAAWQYEFFAEMNENRLFHSPNGDEMTEYLCQTLDDEAVWQGDSFLAVGKPLIGSGKMYFLLPEEGTRPENLLSDPQVLAFLNSAAGRSALPTKQYDVRLRVPKFDVSSNLDLIQSMTDLGIHDAFDPLVSDFTPLTTDTQLLSVSEIRHAARVKIDEEGCIAAAFTQIEVAESAEEPEEKEKLDFNLDRPFLFCITNREGMPLFIGTVNHPAAP